MPEVSICVPTYNRADCLDELIQSILTQDYTDYEVIIVDDCSTDHTSEVVAQYLDPRIRYVTNGANLGMVGNWNRSLEVASSNVIWIVHDDDRMVPGALAHVARVHHANPIGLLYGRHRYFGSTGFTDKSGTASEENVEIWTAGERAIDAVTTQPVSCVTVSIRKEAFRALGGFDAAFPYSADEEYWPRIAQYFAVASTNRVLIDRRLHADNYMVRTWQQADFYTSYSELYRRVAVYLDQAGGSHNQVAEIYNRPCHAILSIIVSVLLGHGETKLAAKYLTLYHQECVRRGLPPWNTRVLIFRLITALPAPFAQQLTLAYRWCKARMGM